MSDEPAPSPPAHPNDELFAHLAARDVRCLGCRYLLRGCRSIHCPECGRPLDLNELRTIDAAQKNELRAFGCLLIIASMPLILLGVAMVVVLAMQLRVATVEPLWTLLIAATLLSLGVLPAAMGRRMSRRLSPEAPLPDRCARDTTAAILLLLVLGLVDVALAGGFLVFLIRQ